MENWAVARVKIEINNELVIMDTTQAKLKPYGQEERLNMTCAIQRRYIVTTTSRD